MYLYFNMVSKELISYDYYMDMKPHIPVDWNINTKGIYTDLDSIYKRSNVKPHVIAAMDVFFESIFSLRNVFLGSSFGCFSTTGVDFTLAKFNSDYCSKILTGFINSGRLIEIKYIHFYRGYTKSQVGFRIVYNYYDKDNAKSVLNTINRCKSINEMLLSL